MSKLHVLFNMNVYFSNLVLGYVHINPFSQRFRIDHCFRCFNTYSIVLYSLANGANATPTKTVCVAAALYLNQLDV